MQVADAQDGKIQFEEFLAALEGSLWSLNFETTLEKNKWINLIKMNE